MRKPSLKILVLALLIALVSVPSISNAQLSQDDEDLLEDALEEDVASDDADAYEDEEEEADTEDTEDVDEEDRAAEDEGEDTEDAAPKPATRRPGFPILPGQRSRIRPPTTPKVFVGEADEDADEVIEISNDSIFNLNYVFNDAPESFDVTYHVKIKGKVAARTAVIRGDAEISANVKGFLAKWPTGECKLNITFPQKAKFQLTFRRTDDENANIDLNFLKPIVEQWESNCTFTSPEAKPFVTKGNLEKWLHRILAKTSPPLRKIIAKISDYEETTAKFVVNRFQIRDPPLGSIEAEGSGVFKFTPARVTAAREE